MALQGAVVELSTTRRKLGTWSYPHCFDAPIFSEICNSLDIMSLIS